MRQSLHEGQRYERGAALAMNSSQFLGEGFARAFGSQAAILAQGTRTVAGWLCIQYEELEKKGQMLGAGMRKKGSKPSLICCIRMEECR